MMFDEKTIHKLGYYVYLLVDPRDQAPFYVGKGIGNRVFAHLEGALKDEDKNSLKYDVIRELKSLSMKPGHLIVRHGLNSDVAFEVEASLIDVLQFMKYKKTNIAGGHNSVEKGLMTSDEITRLYNAEKLDSIQPDSVIININKTYKRAAGADAIYLATKEIWAIKASRVPTIKYVMSEYRGLIVEVFKVDEWYTADKPYGKDSKKTGQSRPGYGFNGQRAEDEVRNLYINKSIAHHKKRGDMTVVKFKL
jgi:hypothetical protein